MDSMRPDEPQPSINEQASRSLRGEGPKRRPTRTPDQIARKRDQDREAQRVSRERTRRRIEEAEVRIEQLEATTGSQENEIARVTAERDAAHLTIRRLTQQLETMNAQLEILRGNYGPLPPSIGHGAVVVNDTVNRHDSRLIDGVSRLSDGVSHTPSSLQPSAHSSPNGPRDADLASPRSVSDPRRELSVTRKNERSVSPRNAVASSRAHLTPQYSPASTPTTDAGISNQLASSDLDNVDRSSSPWVEPWSRKLNNGPPVSPYDHILALFHKSMKDARERGESVDYVMGGLTLAGLPMLQSLPSLRALGIDPQPGRIQPISRLVTDIMGTVDIFHGVAEQIAYFWLLYLNLRWQINPNRQNWEQMPEWMRPRPVQFVVQHQPWVDAVAWPRMRERIIEQRPQIQEFGFSMPYLESLCVNWPHADMDTIAQRFGSGEVIVNMRFERHLRNLDNWSLGPAFAAAFPSLTGTY
ncbi:hypothetical protein MBLNU459_g5563t1 [Dothideomycetes sp. NU459]